MRGSNHNNFYNKRLRRYGRELRLNSTKSEAVLWKHVLRAGKMRGYQFRRQRPILTFIVDFICFELNLIIEADGITHHDEVVIINDKLRQKQLEEHGYTVMRFTDNEILKHLWSVDRAIEDWIVGKEKESS